LIGILLFHLGTGEEKPWTLHAFFMENKFRSQKIGPITEAVFFPRTLEERKRVFP